MHTFSEVGHSALETARDAGTDVASTARDEVRHVADEAVDQAHRVTADVKQRVRDEAERQHGNLTGRVGQFASELYAMAAERPETPARELITLLADRSTAFAEYLDKNGPEKALTELQDFARRRPGTFIVAAVAAGFVVGRLGKGLWQTHREETS